LQAARSVRGVTTMAASFYDYSAKLLGTGTRDAPVDGSVVVPHVVAHVSETPCIN